MVNPATDFSKKESLVAPTKLKCFGFGKAVVEIILLSEYLKQSFQIHGHQSKYI